MALDINQYATNSHISELRMIFARMRDVAKARWPGDANVIHIVVSSFIFLRFFCPAILNPKLFNMMPGLPITRHPQSLMQRHLRPSIRGHGSKPDTHGESGPEHGEFCTFWGERGIYDSVQ